MKRSLVVLAVFLSACTTSADETTTTSTEVTVTTVNSTTEPSTTSVPGETTPVVLAPDFTLDLGDGGTFTLSETTKPVYLLFWAEWCPVCRKEIPIIDRLSAEYGDRVEFVAPVWKSAEEHARSAAAELMPSGVIRWGLDIEREIFGLYDVRFQPVTVLISPDRTVIDAWAGVRSETRIRELLDGLAPTQP